MSNYIISESYHNKKNIPIWLVKPKDKLDLSTFRKVESAIKIMGGYYSRFTHSFVFEKEPTTEKLDEAFGGIKGISQQAKEAGVSENKLAKIQLGKYGSVNRRVLRSEYDAGKLMVARVEYFDGMYDTTRSIPDDEQVWSTKDSGFEKEFDYTSRSPYVSGNVIRFGSYEAKYKPEITPLVVEQSSQAKSFNFYVDVDNENKVNSEDRYELDRVDSNRKDLEKGMRVVMSLYGNKYCGTIIDKQISKYSTVSWTMMSNKKEVVEHEDVRYKVQLDNGITQTYSNFKLDTENECDELTVPAISFDGQLYLPEQFWSSDIVSRIKTINGLKKQKASRKKAEYAQQDEKAIIRYSNELKRRMETWLGWEQTNLDYARKITGETQEAQHNRIDKWITEFSIKPEAPVLKSKTIYDKLKELNTLI